MAVAGEGAENGSPREPGGDFGASADSESPGASGESYAGNGEPRAEESARESERRSDAENFAQRGGGERRNENRAAAQSFAQRVTPSEDQKGWQNRGRNGRPQRGAAAVTTARSATTINAAAARRSGENWWARRWVEVLERFAVGRRLGRGRNYARQGHIVDIEIGKGFVTAHVQGSRDAPYLVRMHFSMLSSTDWKKLTRALAQRPTSRVELGMGQIPESIEQVFEEQRLSLFPNASGGPQGRVLVPGQRESVQARRRGVLPARRGVRPRSVPDLPAARHGARRAARGARSRGDPAAVLPPPADPAYGADGERLDGDEGEPFAPLPWP